MTDAQKHFVIDIEYLNDIALNIADNIPEAYYGKFCKELYEYLKCAIPPLDEDDDGDYVSESESDDSDGASSLDEEVISVKKDDDGFYELTECDVKDCNSVGKEEKNNT